MLVKKFFVKLKQHEWLKRVMGVSFSKLTHKDVLIYAYREYWPYEGKNPFMNEPF